MKPCNVGTMSGSSIPQPSKPRSFVVTRRMDDKLFDSPVGRASWFPSGGPDSLTKRRGGPILSAVILNYNGERWLTRCLNSVKAQTIASEIEVILVDNDSQDGSKILAERLMHGWPNGRFVSLDRNYGFCGGNNRAAQWGSGKYLLFLNGDTWLEANCLEELVAEMERSGAGGGGPLVLEYASNEVQDAGAAGFDIFGVPVALASVVPTPPVFSCCGAAFLIERQLFWKIGGFDERFFMYGEEQDLFWRVWMAGQSVRLAPAARLHHRGEANANPVGGERVVELRTSARVRYLANRNALVTLLKNSEHILLLLPFLHALLLVPEALVWLIMCRRLGFIRDAYWKAWRDVWRMRGHICAERRRLRSLRQRSDWWFLRFLRLKPGRWRVLERVVRLGLPRVVELGVEVGGVPSEYRPKALALQAAR